MIIMKSTKSSSIADDLVKQYLRQRGLNSVLDLLEQETAKLSQTEGENMSEVVVDVFPDKSDDILYSFAEDIIVDGLCGGNELLYSDSFDAYRSWAFSSLESISSELLSVCFPLFVCCYIGQVRKGLIEEAKSFWNKYKRGPPDFFLLYSDEMVELSMLTTPLQLTDPDFMSSNAFIRCSSENRFTVQLTPFTYQLLVSFLMRSEVLLIATIVNEKIDFERIENTDEGGRDYLVRLQGYTPIDITGGRYAPVVNLTVPGKVPPRAILESVEATAETSSRSILSDPLLPDLVDRLIRPKVLLGRKRPRGDTHGEQGEHSRRAEASKDGVQSQPTKDKASSGRKGGKLANALEPSVIFATLANTYDDMICLHMNSSGSQAVCGFRDSSVRVWRLDHSQTADFGRFCTSEGVEMEGAGIRMSTVLPAASVSIHDDDNEGEDGDSGDRGDGERGREMSWSEAGGETQLKGHRMNEFGSSLSSRAVGNGSPPCSSAGVFPRWGELGDSHPSKGAARGVKNNSSAAKVGAGSAALRLNEKAMHGKFGGFPTLDLRGHTKPVYAVSQDKAGRLVLSGSADETIRLWDVSLAQCVGKYACTSPVWDVSFSPMGGLFASAHQDCASYIYTTERAGPLRVFAGHTSDVTCSRWHPRGVLVATGSDDKSARLWDLRTAQCVRLLTGPRFCINSVACSKDGHLLAVGTEGGTVHMWDLVACRQLGILQGHVGAVHSISFSEDSTALSSGGVDGTVRIWDVNQALAQLSFRDGHRAAPMGVVSSSSSSSSSSSTSYTTSSSSSSAGNGQEISSSLEHPHVRETPESIPLIAPRHTYHTKYTPVYFVDYSPQNLLTAGGPFSLPSTLSGLAAPSTAQATRGNSATVGVVDGKP